MYRNLCIALLLIATTSVQAQESKYENAMLQNITALDDLSKPENLVPLAATFERIALAEKDKWLPFYYAALANLWKGFLDEAANKDELANKAETLIAKAEQIQPANADLAVLKSMAATLHMITDPMSRWQEYGTQVTNYLEKAKEYDRNNPRIYYWEAQNVTNTPEQFGGGKEKAKPILDKSLQLFAGYSPETKLHPHWGKSLVERMLNTYK